MLWAEQWTPGLESSAGMVLIRMLGQKPDWSGFACEWEGEDTRRDNSFQKLYWKVEQRNRKSLVRKWNQEGFSLCFSLSLFFAILLSFTSFPYFLPVVLSLSGTDLRYAFHFRLSNIIFAFFYASVCVKLCCPGRRNLSGSINSSLGIYPPSFWLSIINIFIGREF